ncbi:MAG: rod shape-determining protein MreC [Clostridiales bacterium]|jgi:rod shape-determining protein MreC|nr:rod shape-determining protein MreC [Clostridiales bacterium]
MELLARYKKIFIIGMTILCLGAIVATSRVKSSVVNNIAGFILTPLQSGFSRVGYWIDDRISFIANLESLHRENIALRSENAELVERNRELELAKKDYENLAEYLKIDQLYASYPRYVVRIIAQDPSDWFKKYTIDKGESDGLKVNMIALAPGGVVGMISECYYNYAEVISLMDDRLVISAKCDRTEAFGFVKGDGTLAQQGYCRMDFISDDAEILKEDTVVTSTHSLYFPAGITIGRIVDVKSDAKGRYALIKPEATLDNLETLMIVNQSFKEQLIASPTPTPSPAPAR